MANEYLFAQQKNKGMVDMRRAYQLQQEQYTLQWLSIDIFNLIYCFPINDFVSKRT